MNLLKKKLWTILQYNDFFIDNSIHINIENRNFKRFWFESIKNFNLMACFFFLKFNRSLSSLMHSQSLSKNSPQKVRKREKSPPNSKKIANLKIQMWKIFHIFFWQNIWHRFIAQGVISDLDNHPLFKNFKKSSSCKFDFDEIKKGDSCTLYTNTSASN